MDFARSVLLVLCIGVFGAGVVSAANAPSGGGGWQDGPARSSTSSSVPRLANVAVPTRAATPDTTSATIYYGPPYFTQQYEFPTVNFPSIAAAADYWWSGVQRAYPGAFPGCDYTQTFLPDYEQTGRIVGLTLVGTTCASNGYVNWIQVTAYSNDPGKNIGDGGGCDGGEGHDGGGSGSGAGGNGASPGSTCADSKGAPMAGDPINTSTGNKYLQDDDYTASSWLTFRRFYNSTVAVASTAMGAHWRHSFDRSLEILGTPASSIVLFRPDGKQETFTKTNGQWNADPDIPDIPDILTEIDNAQGVATGYTVFIAALRHTETYDTHGLLQSVTDQTGTGITLIYSTTLTAPAIAPTAGLLLTVTDPKGRQLNFTYDSNGRVHQVTLPDGGTLTYAYDTNGNLLSVQYPDGKSRQYVYNESTLTGGANLLNAMTGIIDTAGTRYESTAFDSSGRATASVFAGNVGSTGISYNSDGTSMVQYPLGSSATLGFTLVNGLVRVASLNQPCGKECGQPWKTRTYDTNGYPASYTDFNNNVTSTTYDTAGLLTQQIDASGTPSQRTTNITWNTALRVPLTRVVLDASGTTVSATQWVYNSAGQTLARCEVDPTNSAATGYACSATGTVPAGVRRWTYTYCTAVDGTQCPIVGLLLTATGPRTDVAQTTTYSYYLDSATSGCPTPGGACHQPGDLHTVTDPAGHVTAVVSYDADGRITRETDANGINTDFTYTPRGWLASRTVGGAETTFGYTPYGAVSSVTDPDGITTRYDYDAAHRLTRVTDAQGNYVLYTLDAAGNKTAEQVFDSSGTAHKSLSRTFNPLGQLTAVVDGLNHTVFDASAAGSYDPNGNLVHSSDGLGIQRQSSYDALNRLVQTIDNYNGTN